MKTRTVSLSLLAVAALAACGGQTPPAPAPAKPEPVVEAAPAPAPEPAPAAPVATPAPAPAPAPTPTGAQESFTTKQAAAAIPADAIGGSPVSNIPEAWVRGNEALKKYCVDNSMQCGNFFTKETPVEASGYWTMQFFGEANGQPMYIGVRVYPDGRAEVVR